jgi:hypothetical protein
VDGARAEHGLGALSAKTEPKHAHCLLATRSGRALNPPAAGFAPATGSGDAWVAPTEIPFARTEILLFAPKGSPPAPLRASGGGAPRAPEKRTA